MLKPSVLHTEWSDGWGGQEIRIINEMLAVREQGVTVFLACRDHAKIKQAAEQHNIPVFTLPFRGNTDIVTLIALVRIIRKHEITMVNTHSGKDTWVGGLAAKCAGAKFIRTRHLSNPIRRSRWNFINSLADFVITTGERVRTAMIEDNRICPEKIRSIPTGVDEAIFNRGLYHRRAMRDRLGLSEDTLAIGIVAVLRSFKRHDLFLLCAQQLKKRFPTKSLKFVVAGEGPRRESIEAQIKTLALQEDVLLLGHVDNVAELMSALDIFVLTSDSKEGVPQSVMQAMLMQLPVVATDVGSTCDLYCEENMLLIPAEDERILVDTVAKLVESPERRAAYVSRSRAFVVDHFSKCCMVRALLAIYSELLSKRSIHEQI